MEREIVVSGTSIFDIDKYQDVLHTENLLPLSQISNIRLDFKMSYKLLKQGSTIQFALINL